MVEATAPEAATQEMEAPAAAGDNPYAGLGLNAEQLIALKPASMEEIAKQKEGAAAEALSTTAGGSAASASPGGHFSSGGQNEIGGPNGIPKI